MPEPAPLSTSQFSANLLHFGRLLRGLGLKVSSSEIADLLAALPLIDIASRRDFRATARALLVSDPADFERFDQAFDLFWRGMEAWLVEFGQTRQLRPPEQREELPGMPEGEIRQQVDEEPPGEDEEPQEPDPHEEPRVQPLYSPLELLRHKNFAAYTDEEKELVQRAMARLVWDLDLRLTRRKRRAAQRARFLDLRGSIRANAGRGEIVELRWRRRKTKQRPLVVICDISGSMEAYSRLFLHFIHALGSNGRALEAFAFGTRLTRLTPALRHGDVDTAVSAVSELVVDWSGGTRIGASLRAFNFEWSRRVLGQGATVLIISDGWERGDMALLGAEMARLRGSARRVLWLNPLAGAEGYRPLVQGIQTVLPFCDEFLPLHNLRSIEQVVEKLGS